LQILSSKYAPSPPVIAVCINKKNFTHDLIKESKVFAVSILSKEAPMKLIGALDSDVEEIVTNLKILNIKLA